MYGESVPMSRNSMCKGPGVGRRVGAGRSQASWLKDGNWEGSRWEVGEVARGHTAQGPVSHSTEFGLSPKSCGHQGSVSAERMIWADRCFERWCWKQDWRSVRDGSKAETSVRKEGEGLDQRAEQLWVCQQCYCQDVRREETKVQDSAGDCSCQEATAHGALEIREREEKTG